jgi:endonuclease YncB( thermonuclease family)
VPYLNDPGPLRRLWWRSTSTTRLSVAVLGVLLSMTATALTMNDTAQPARNKTGPLAASATPRPDDPGVTVRSVSAVDLFNGVDETTGDLIEVRVTGIRSTAPCWAEDALGFARTTLDGKKVWLLKGGHDARDPEGRLLAKVLLPTGQDYTEVAVAAGAGSADAGSDERLRATEAEARHARRGVWASSCAPTTSSVPESSGPPLASTSTPSTPGTPGTTTGSATTTAPVVVPPPPAVTTSPAPQPPDDVQRGVEMGAACSPEGARGVTAKGQDVRCKRKGEDLRWMKA